MDYSLAKELKDACFPQDRKNCKTYTDINDGALVERIAHPTLSELIEACPKQLGTATFVLGSANQGQAWVACYFDFPANRCAELNETGHTPEEAVARLWLALRRAGAGTTADELTQFTRSQSGFGRSVISCHGKHDLRGIRLSPNRDVALP